MASSIPVCPAQASSTFLHSAVMHYKFKCTSIKVCENLSQRLRICHHTEVTAELWDEIRRIQGDVDLDYIYRGPKLVHFCLYEYLSRIGISTRRSAPRGSFSFAAGHPKFDTHRQYSAKLRRPSSDGDGDIDGLWVPAIYGRLTEVNNRGDSADRILEDSQDVQNDIAVETEISRRNAYSGPEIGPITISNVLRPLCKRGELELGHDELAKMLSHNGVNLVASVSTAICTVP
ncbi:hypothetical protein V8E54_002316 [Elaphomyces granulatus]